MAITLIGGFDADLKGFVYDVFEALLEADERPPLTQILADQELAQRLTGQEIHLKRTAALTPFDIPAIVIRLLPETPTEEFIGMGIEEERQANVDGKWEAHFGARYRMAVALDCVSLNSKLRDDLYRLLKVLAMIAAYNISRDKSCGLQNPRLLPQGEGQDEFAEDPNIVYHASVVLEAEYELGVTDAADAVGTVQVGTITPTQG